MYQRSELDYLIYNAPLAYADLIVNGNLGKNLRAIIRREPLNEQWARCKM